MLGSRPTMRPVMTPETLARVPNAPKTPLKSFRIPEDLYRAAQVKAAERGESVSDVVRAALERYVKRK
jgi:predicted HicB family RNase H-like nuclease